jgi:hypothetical protein
MKLRMLRNLWKRPYFKLAINRPEHVIDLGALLKQPLLKQPLQQMRMNEAGAKSTAMHLLRTWRRLKLQAFAIIAHYNECAFDDFRNFNSKLFRWQRYHETIHGLAERDVRMCIGESLGLTGCFVKPATVT